MLAHQMQHILDLCFIILILLIYNHSFIDFVILKLHCSVSLCILIVAINKKNFMLLILLNYKKNNKIIHYIVKNQQILGLVTKY